LPDDFIKPLLFNLKKIDEKNNNDIQINVEFYFKRKEL
jgi:hypothetical protein